MSQKTQGMFTPALVGGVVAGVITALPFLGCFCCLWIIGGAMLAAYLLARNSPVSLTAGEGAIVGIFTGIIAAVVDAFISVPFQALNRDFAQKFMDQVSHFFEDLPEGWESIIERAGAGTTPALFLLGLLVSATVFAAFGALGGVIGVSLFGKKTPPVQTKGTENETTEDSGHRQS